MLTAPPRKASARRVGGRPAGSAGRRVRAAGLGTRRGIRGHRRRGQALAVAGFPGQRRHRRRDAFRHPVSVVAAPVRRPVGLPRRGGHPVAWADHERTAPRGAAAAQPGRPRAAPGMGHRRDRARRRRRAATAPAQRADRGGLVRRGDRVPRRGIGEPDQPHVRGRRPAGQRLAGRGARGRGARPAARRGARGAMAGGHRLGRARIRGQARPGGQAAGAPSCSPRRRPPRCWSPVTG